MSITEQPNIAGLITEITADNLQQVVTEVSKETPVLLDIWAEWCQPCKAQLPILMKLLEEYQGKFRLAKLNAEDPDPRVQRLAQDLMMQLQVRSIPALVLVHGGQVVNVMVGLQKEADLRALLDEVTMSPADRIQQQIEQLVADGQAEQALQLLQQILVEEPNNGELQLLQANLLLQLGQIDNARQVIEALPDDLPGAEQPKAKLAFLDMAQDIAPRAQVTTQLEAHPDDHEARYQMAIHQVLSDEMEGAFENLLEIVRKDRAFREDGARLLMLRLFNQLGADPLVRRFRNRLFSLMH
ncbi:tetratricopeptide repeat protein [Sansalvadorimonas sp. 2012CJ34-2]|uniref:Tetratricopeptide repeat protein n=1 Tax=Parendozoicomonas callyspongiae TaxID=2942213 RepID=A0ABT0PJK7_9GAMM|nr:tetratricopeptide repeat protein [Sansalvadorimonas sp. 2012CJ34-2]MCL6271577.1 tetratricopeptide repeat protein [Sansalvadorimonas sp. 2012CJ34-2]